MSKKSSRTINVGRKIKLLDKRPLPEPAEEMTVDLFSTGPRFEDRVSEHQVEPKPSANDNLLGMSDLSTALPICPSAYSRSSVPSREDSYSRLCNSSYYNDQDSEIGSAAWDEYWDRCETESSDFSQSGASFMSWSDEIEVETTRKVQEMYDEIERFLYDEGPSHNLSAELLEECLQWKSKFKYLRVVGVGIKPTLETRQATPDETNEDEVFCENCSDSDDDQTITQSTPSYVEFNEETERFKYDDITMGSKCESDQSVLRDKVTTSVMDGLFAHVWPKVETILEPHVVSFIRDVSNDPNSINKSVHRPVSSSLSRKPRSILPSQISSTLTSRPLTTLQQIDIDESLRIAPKSIHQSARAADHRTNFVSEQPTTRLGSRPTTVVKSLSPVCRSVITTPLNVCFEPQVTESRAYHSALSRQASSKSLAERRLSSISMGYDGRRISRQDVILKDLQEDREKLAELSVATTSTRNSSKKYSPEVRKRCPWTGNLPPIDKIERTVHNQSSGRPESKASNSKLSTRTNVLAPKMLEPLNFPNSIEIHGTGLKKVDVLKQRTESVADFPMKLKKYETIGKKQNNS